MSGLGGNNNVNKITDGVDIALISASGEQLVVVNSSLPAGTNNIGDVDIASAIPAGNNNIGDVDIASAIPAGNNVIGQVKVTDGTHVLDMDENGAISVNDNNNLPARTYAILNLTATGVVQSQVLASGTKCVVIGLRSGDALQTWYLYDALAGTTFMTFNGSESLTLDNVDFEADSLFLKATAAQVFEIIETVR